MTLPYAPPKYDQADQAKVRTLIERRDKQNRKRGQDLEIAGAERLIKASPNGSRWEIVVSDAGVVSAVAL